jgi:GATA-binding protein
MDSFHFDSYISSPYSGSSAPRTPSPQTSISSDGAPSPAHFKTELEPVCSIFSDQMLEDHAVPSEGHSLWQGLSHQSLPFNGSRGSLLGELYDHDLPADRPANIYDQPNDTGEWQAQLSRQLHHHPSQEAAAMRRATYPYVRHDRDAPASYSPAPFIPQDCEQSRAHYPHSDTSLYGEPLPLVDNSPQLISFGQDNHSFHPAHYDMSVSSSPASSFVEFENLDHNVKLEESAPVIVPSQTCLYRPPSSGAMHGMTYLPHAGLPVQHTDDAASKETQYLRRRCFNCSQTEPPSWRRSTLNPGKIVCNKCGLYERTHLRPRPLRFDELRTGNKSRKQSKSISGSSASKLIKKEVESQAMSRRASVSSSSSSVHSSSDWDDSVSVYSSGSAPTSSFNSPAVTSFSLPLERSSQSPPLGSYDGGIRLPNAPLSDIASLQSVPASPRKVATSPDYGLASVIQGDYHSRQTSLPVDIPKGPSVEMPEITGWQAVPMAGSPPNKSTKPSALRKTVAT